MRKTFRATIKFEVLALTVFVAVGGAAAPIDDLGITRKLGYPYYTGEVIPKPKQAVFLDAFIELGDPATKTCSVCALIGKTATSQERAAAEQLQRRLNLAFDKEPKFRVVTDENDIPPTVGAVISVGTPRTNEWNAAILDKANIQVNATSPGPDGSGYVLFATDYRGKKVIVCCGGDGLGSYYATRSLNQLIAVRNGKLVARQARITDWPTLRRRTAGGDDAPEVIDWMTAYKLNVYVQSYNDSKYWFAPSPERTRSGLAMCERATGTGTFKYDVAINPYTPYHRREDPKNRKIKISDDADVQALIAHYRLFLNAGANAILLACDDFVWVDKLEFTLFYPEDKARFKDVAESHVYLANAVYTALAKERPDLEMFFCPSYYAEKHVLEWAREPELGKRYLRKLGEGLLPRVKIMLTGPKVLSPTITQEDVTRLRHYLGDRDWYLWDNMSGGYFTDRLGSRKPFGIFRPFAPKLPLDFLKSSLYVFNSRVSGTAWSQRARVIQISIADYCWNPEGYDPEWSLRQAIDSYIGPGMAPLLTRFGDLYAAVDESIAEVNATATTPSETKKTIFEDSFEDKGLGPESTPIRWNAIPRNDEDTGARLEKGDAPDGAQCAVSQSRRKGYLLRSANNAFALPLEDAPKYAFSFFWKTSDPKAVLRVYLMANNSATAFLYKDLSAPNVEWNHYRVPLTDFKVTEQPNQPIKQLTGVRFYQKTFLEHPAVLKLDKARLAMTTGEDGLPQQQRRFAAMEAFKALFKTIEATCWDEKLVKDLKTRVFEPKLKAIERFYKKPLARVPRADQPPVIDGKLDDACWRTAEKTGPFKANVDDTRSITETRAMMTYDPNNLYIAFSCKADKWDEDAALVTGKDGSIGANDAVEIFIEPVLGSGHYFHLAANRAGGMMDQEKRARKYPDPQVPPQPEEREAGRKWDPTWEVKTAKNAGSWTAEIRVPFSALEKKPAAGETWGLNLCRSYAPAGEYGAWSCTYGGFHAPFFFGKALFEDAK